MQGLLVYEESPSQTLLLSCKLSQVGPQPTEFHFQGSTMKYLMLLIQGIATKGGNTNDSREVGGGA